MKPVIVRPTAFKAFFARKSGWHQGAVIPRGKNRPLGKGLNQQTLIRISSFLHHNASHSVPVIEARWRVAEQRFHRRHLGHWRATMRFANTFTAHRWM